MASLRNRRRRRRMRRQAGDLRPVGTAYKPPPSTAYGPIGGKGKGKPKPQAPTPSAPAPRPVATQMPSAVIPGRKGKRSPTIKPFMTAEDMMQRAAAQTLLQEKLTNLDYALGQQKSQTDYEKAGIERERIRDIADTNDEMAGRGMFQSSIRDADLFDIDSTAAIRKNFLDRELDAATMNTQNQKVIARQAWDSFIEALNQKKVENAREASKGMPEWLIEPRKTRKNPAREQWFREGILREQEWRNTNQERQASFLQEWQDYLDELDKWKAGKGKKKKKQKRMRPKTGTVVAA